MNYPVTIDKFIIRPNYCIMCIDVLIELPLEFPSFTILNIVVKDLKDIDDIQMPMNFSSYNFLENHTVIFSDPSHQIYIKRSIIEELKKHEFVLRFFKPQENNI